PFGLGAQLNAPESQGGLGVFLYLSGTTFFTLGLGDVVPLNPLGRALVVAEVGTGIIFLAMIIGYLPTLDQAYAQREVGVQLLESRAGSPQSAVRLLRRFGRPESAEVLAAWRDAWRPTVPAVWGQRPTAKRASGYHRGTSHGCAPPWSAQVLSCQRGQKRKPDSQNSAGFMNPTCSPCRRGCSCRFLSGS